jgi:hypothetical protein
MPIFFVVGYQKSGTTWLMEMLDSHPEILCRARVGPSAKTSGKSTSKRGGRATRRPPSTTRC